jgi:hypothetical protein
MSLSETRIPNTAIDVLVVRMDSGNWSIVEPNVILTLDKKKVFHSKMSIEQARSLDWVNDDGRM